MHQLGQLLHSVPDLAKLDRAADVQVGARGGASGADAGITAYHLVNPDTKAHFHILRNDRTDDVLAAVPLAGVNVPLPVPVPGLDARLLATGLRLGRRTLRYSSAQPMLWLTAGRQDIAVFTGRKGRRRGRPSNARASPRSPCWRGRPTTRTRPARCASTPNSAV